MTIDKTDMSAGTQAEATIADGPKPLPDGRPVLVEQVSEMRGSMLGRAGTLRTVATFSNHRPVIKSPRN